MLGNKNAFSFPVAMRHEDHFNFSFSGLKTKALEVIKRVKSFDESTLADFCASIREAIAVALAERSINAARGPGPKESECVAAA